MKQEEGVGMKVSSKLGTSTLSRVVGGSQNNDEFFKRTYCFRAIDCSHTKNAIIVIGLFFFNTKIIVEFMTL